MGIPSDDSKVAVKGLTESAATTAAAAAASDSDCKLCRVEVVVQERRLVACHIT